MKKYLPNLITLARMGLAVGLVFVPFGGLLFTVLYLSAGISDMADGFVARLTGCVSRLGGILDSLADILFFGVAAWKILPSLGLSAWMWVGAGVVLLVRVANLVTALIRKRKPIFLHTAWNKAEGVLLFLLPMTVNRVDLRFSAALVLAVGVIAAVEEQIRLRK